MLVCIVVVRNNYTVQIFWLLLAFGALYFAVLHPMLVLLFLLVLAQLIFLIVNWNAVLGFTMLIL